MSIGSINWCWPCLPIGPWRAELCVSMPHYSHSSQACVITLQQPNNSLCPDCVPVPMSTCCLSLQMRHHPHVESSNQLKDMLLDAYARRCLQTSQQPVYHMHPLSAALGEQQQQQPGAGAGQQQAEHVAYTRDQRQQHQLAPAEGPFAPPTGVGMPLADELAGFLGPGDAGGGNRITWRDVTGYFGPRRQG